MLVLLIRLCLAGNTSGFYTVRKGKGKEITALAALVAGDHPGGIAEDRRVSWCTSQHDAGSANSTPISDPGFGKDDGVRPQEAGLTHFRMAAQERKGADHSAIADLHVVADHAIAHHTGMLPDADVGGEFDILAKNGAGFNDCAVTDQCGWHDERGEAAAAFLNNPGVFEAGFRIAYRTKEPVFRPNFVIMHTPENRALAWVGVQNAPPVVQKTRKLPVSSFRGSSPHAIGNFASEVSSGDYDETVLQRTEDTSNRFIEAGLTLPTCRTVLRASTPALEEGCLL